MRPSQQLEVAMMEMEMRADLFNAMVSHCFVKCIRKLPSRLPHNADYTEQQQYHMGQLTLKESACTDRCVQKFMQTQECIKKRMEAMDKQKTEQMKLQMQAQQKLQSWFG